MSTRRVEIAPGQYATPKVVSGVEVLEVHAGYYLSRDQRVSAYKHRKVDGDAFTGWVVAASRDVVLDPIATKPEALRTLAALHATLPPLKSST